MNRQRGKGDDCSTLMPNILSNSYPHGCPCWFYGDPIKECSCSASSIARYQKRISGPLLDRIDIHVEVPRVDYEKLADKRNVENSETIRKRVQAARERQLQRFKGTKLTCNAEMGPSEVREFCGVEPSAEKLLTAAMQQLHLSARAFHRVLKLARTIADLAECDLIAANHLAEAIQYRPRWGCRVSTDTQILATEVHPLSEGEMVDHSSALCGLLNHIRYLLSFYRMR